MALTDVTVTFNLTQLLGETFDARRTRAYVKTNVSNGTLMDTSTGEIRMGDQKVTVGDDGTGSFTTWAPGADGNPTSWQTSLVVEYPRTGQRDRQVRTFGPFTITASVDLSVLEPEQAVPAEYLTQVTEELQTYSDAAATSATAAQTARTGAEAARDEAQALVLSDLGTTDGQTRALIENPASQTASALSASYVGRDTIPTAAVIADGTSHPLSEFFGTLAEAQAVFSAATSLTDEWDWAAIQSCIDNNFGGAVIWGQCFVNRTITLPVSGWLMSVGRQSASITQDTDNIPIVSCLGQATGIDGVSLLYARSQPAANTNAACLYISNIWQTSTFRRMQLGYGAYGIKSDPTKPVFSTTFENIEIVGFSISAFDVRTDGTVGNTGNVISNMYIHNKSSRGGTQGTVADARGRFACTEAPFRINNYSDGVINQLNIEWCRAATAVEINTCREQVFNGLHIEGFVITSSYAGLITLSGGEVATEVNGLTVFDCDFLAADGAATFGLFRYIGGGSSTAMGVLLNGADLAGNATDLVSRGLVLANNIGATAATFSARFVGNNVKLGSFNTLQVGDSTPLPVVETLNGVRTAPTWTTPTLSNSWVAAGSGRYAPQYTKDSTTGWVTLRGAAKSGASGTVAFTLPAGSRPGAIENFPAYSYTAGDVIVLGGVVILTSGEVYLYGDTNSVSLSGVRFRAA